MTDITTVIRDAHAAQRGWGRLPYGKRAGYVKEAARYLGSHADEIAAMIHGENGKLKIDALAAEILPALMGVRWYIKNGKKFLAPKKTGTGSLLMFNKRSRVVYEPWGVVGIISPWNYPFAIPFAEVVMALLAGNAVVLKTASVTPGAGRAIAQMFGALPAGVFNLVEMPGREAGPAFIEGGVDKLCFTGSTATGRELMALASKRLLPLVLELGGADAAIIRADADLDRAACGILWAGFSNAGQSCGGAQRILVHREVYAAFVEKLSALVAGMRPGRGIDCDLGPMTTVKQKETVEAAVEQCIAMGAKAAAKSGLPAAGALAGGASPDDDAWADRFTPAVLLTDVSAGMPVMSEEIFGPVAAVVPVEDDEEALRIANESSYGLTGSVWSRDGAAARRIAERINAGAVMINDHLMSHGLAETPWGGFGDSGLGRTHGRMGFMEMLKAKVIVGDIMPGVKSDIYWHPYSAKVYDGIRALTVLFGGSLADKLRAVPSMLYIVSRYWANK